MLQTLLGLPRNTHMLQALYSKAAPYTIPEKDYTFRSADHELRVAANVSPASLCK